MSLWSNYNARMEGHHGSMYYDNNDQWLGRFIILMGGTDINTNYIRQIVQISSNKIAIVLIKYYKLCNINFIAFHKIKPNPPPQNCNFFVSRYDYCSKV